MNYEVMRPKERKALLEGVSSFKISLAFHNRTKTRYQTMHSQVILAVINTKPSIRICCS